MSTTLLSQYQLTVSLTLRTHHEQTAKGEASALAHWNQPQEKLRVERYCECCRRGYSIGPACECPGFQWECLEEICDARSPCAARYPEMGTELRSGCGARKTCPRHFSC